MTGPTTGDSTGEPTGATTGATTGVTEPGPEIPEPGPEIPERVIALALEFAVGLAAAGAKQRAPLAIPAGLRPFLKVQRLPATALGTVRAVGAADPAFRKAVARAARLAPEMLDEASMLWLTRPDGWQERLRELAAAREELDRRTGASASVDAELDRLRAELAAVRAEAERQQGAARRADALRRTAEERSVALTAERDTALERATTAETVRDEVLRARAAGGAGAGAAGAAGMERLADERAVLGGAARVADELAEQTRVVRRLTVDLERLATRLAELEPSVGPVTERPAAERAPAAGRTPARGSGRASRRRPIGVPGGLVGSSLAAAEHVVRTPGAVVIVDGYNVAKLRFPLLDLETQRERCIDLCEDVARRWGTDLVVVFDGANAAGVAGVAGSVRRLVRVTYSPEGVIADDVIRAEVAALPDEVPVVVVTNDRAIVQDVRTMGANPVSSDRFVELATR
ncbi:MAG: NYN domain-containing protein [Actinomycetes bacterium]